MAPEELISEDDVIAWLLQGDAAMRYQVYRDLLDRDASALRMKIPLDGVASVILGARQTNGHWGKGFYMPKWTCSHYSLLELRDLEVPSDQAECVETVEMIAASKSRDGGVDSAAGDYPSDVCINGMFLAYASHFMAKAPLLESVVDFVLSQQMPDGGFNCHSNRKGASVSSVHTTISVINGLSAYLRNGYGYRSEELPGVITVATESLLARNLYQAKLTGEPIREEFTKPHYPARWHFDVLHGLDVLRSAEIQPDPRLKDALCLLLNRRRPDGRWTSTSQYPGEAHVIYPNAREPNRWVTLRALRVLRYFRSVYE